MPTMDEQETTVTQLRNGDSYVYTANPVHLRKLRADARATEVKGGEDWAEFIIPNAAFDPLKGFKVRREPLTEEQRREKSERMKRLRDSQLS